MTTFQFFSFFFLSSSFVWDNAPPFLKPKSALNGPVNSTSPVVSVSKTPSSAVDNSHHLLKLSSLKHAMHAGASRCILKGLSFTFEKKLERPYIIVLSLVPVQLGCMVTRLLCSNMSRTYRFGKGMMPTLCLCKLINPPNVCFLLTLSTPSSSQCPECIATYRLCSILHCYIKPILTSFIRFFLRKVLWFNSYVIR